MKNVFFFHTINKIGGVETFFYELARKYHKKYDITIYYIKADKKQLERLERYVRTVRWDGGEVECENAFFNYNLEPLISHIHAKKVFQIVHADFKLQTNIEPHVDERVNTYIAVSQRVADSFKETTGIECEVCANPLTYDKTPNPLFLCSAQRMTSEKGVDRIKALAQKLDLSGIPYYWMIFTNGTQTKISDNVVFMPSRLDIRSFIQACDAFVALSDSEGRCYSVGEKLASGSGKLLITPCPSFFEQGCNEENSIVMRFDMSDIDNAIDRLRELYENNAPKKSFKPLKVEDRWEDFLAKGKPKYHPPIYYRVHATKLYHENHVYDAELGFIPQEGFEFIVSGVRMDQLLHSPYGAMIVVDGQA